MNIRARRASGHLSAEPPTGIDQRRPVSSPASVPPQVLDALHRGQTETRSLGEWLAVDRLLLLGHLLPDPEHADLRAAAARAVAGPRLTAIAQSQAIGKAWAANAELDAQACALLATHASDLASELVACVVGARATSLPERLDALRVYAADPHFGIREVAWLAVRDAIVAAPELALSHLAPWVHDPDPNLRRYAVEATRPRGVWAAHIGLLKRDPERGLLLLEPLRAEPHKYPRDSVANWLNDAAKTRPEFVYALAQRWRAASPSEHTARLLKRALRSIDRARSGI